MFPLTIFISHFVSDFAFTNVYSTKFLDKKNYYKHLIWVVLVFLAFNFDMLKGWSLLIVFLSLFLHAIIDLIRIRKSETNLSFELLWIGVFLLLSYLFRSFFQNSFISEVFQFYIVGMVVSTSFGSFLFRTFNILEKQQKDTIGASERLAIYIFALANNYLWIVIAITAGLVYKLIFSKEKNIKELFFSPLYGLISSMLWSYLMLQLF
jgi:hypothetical protein